ncbi:TPA: hypothetical protein ACFP4Y_001753 [Neisseria bacilliformis]
MAQPRTRSLLPNQSSFFPKKPKLRAWLRHTLCLSGGGRLKSGFPVFQTACL